MSRRWTPWIFLVLFTAGVARGEESVYAPVAIAPRASDGAAISCAHFRARVRSEFEGIRELKWHLDDSASRQQLQDYFVNRLAADPVDVAGQRVADVTWSIPKADFPAGAQVVAFYELTRQDYSGAQMRFEVPDRAVEAGGSAVEIRSPVRMVDACVNGEIELKVFSQCPMEQLKYWRPNQSVHEGTKMIAFPNCAKVDTLRLGLNGVESKLEEDKSELRRGGDRKVFPIRATAANCASPAVQAAAMLEQLRGVDRLHNCQLDVVRRDEGGSIQYSVYARDLQACARSASACFESELSLAVPAECGSDLQSVSPSVRFMSEVKRSDGEVAAEFSSQLNRAGQLMRLSLSHLDRKTGVRMDRVICRAGGGAYEF